jgi:hypothetical protein
MRIITFSYSLCFLLLFIKVKLVCSSSNLNVSRDIESLLIEDSVNNNQYIALSASDENSSSDSNITTTDENPEWKVPLAQYYIGFPINGIIFGFLTTLSQEGFFSYLFEAVYFVSFIVCVHLYFGFSLSFHHLEESCCSFIPIPKISRVIFPSNEMDVTFFRWIVGPISWIFEVFSYLPPGSFSYLKRKAYFPDQSIFHLMFMVTFLFYLGVADWYKKSMMRS